MPSRPSTRPGKKASVKVFGWDLTAQAVKGIDEGWVAAVVQQDPYTEGKVAIESLETLKKGGKVDPVIHVPVTIVTKANRRPLPRHVQVRTGPFLSRPRAAEEPQAENVMASLPPRVRMRGISKRYGAIQTLDDVSLDLAPGEVLGLVGDNGAGKSTLSKVLSGAVVPDSGTIEIDGTPVTFASPADARAQHVEMVYQDLSLCDTVDVAGNLFLGREPRRRILGLPFLDKPRMRADASAMLQSLGIVVPDISVHVENLSGGQRQSIAIGRAASFAPKVLIMDEPTAALAVAEVEAVLELIRTVSAKGVSVILITHRLQDLFLVCDRLQVMYEGRSIAERAIPDTNLEEVVDLIVGRKFSARSARTSSGTRAAGSGAPRDPCPVTAPLHATSSGVGTAAPPHPEGPLPGQWERRLDRAVLRRRRGAVLGHDRRLPVARQHPQHPAPVGAAADRRDRHDARHHDGRHRPLGRIGPGADERPLCHPHPGRPCHGSWWWP